MIIQDADLEYIPKDIAQLWAEAQRGADVVFGSRYLTDPSIQNGRRMLQSGVRLLNFMVYLLHGIRITDEATCYKMFRTEDLRAMDLQCSRFGFCPEATSKAIRMGLTIQEVPISYESRSDEDGKKLRLRDGLYAIWQLIRSCRWKPPRAVN